MGGNLPDYMESIPDSLLSRALTYRYYSALGFTQGLIDDTTSKYPVAAKTKTMVVAENGSTGYAGLVAHAAGDVVYDLRVPFEEFDKSRAISIAVLLSSTQATADEPICKFWYRAFSDGAVVADPQGGTAITLTKATMAGAAAMTLSPFTSIAAHTFAKNTLYYIGLEVDDLGGASADELTIYGIWAKGYLAITGEN